MSNFVLIPISEIKGRTLFFKLSVNNKCQIEEFETTHITGTTYVSESITIKAYMDLWSNGQRLPIKKFRFLKSKGSCFEFKSKHLRYYGFQLDGQMIICLANFNKKNEQDSDIDKLQGIHKLYVEKLKTKTIENGKRKFIEK